MSVSESTPGQTMFATGEGQEAKQEEGRKNAQTAVEEHRARKKNAEETGAPTYEKPKNLLAGKYESEEDLQKGILEALKKTHGGNLEEAYKALESGIGASKAGDDKSTSSAPPADSGTTETPSGSDPLGDAVQHYLDNGELTEDHKTLLKEKGIPPEMAESFVEGRAAVAHLQASESRRLYAEAVGGEKELEALEAWAEENLDEAQKKAIKAQKPKTRDEAIALVRGLHAQFKEAKRGTTSGMLSGSQGGAPSGTRGFSSRKEYLEHVRDPRYHTSGSFRQSVRERLKASRWVGA